MKVVIVGGGFGGIKTALELRNRDGIEVALISPSSEFTYQRSVYRSRQGRAPLEMSVPLEKVFEGSKNISYAQDTIVAVDPKNKLIKGKSGQLYGFDQLVLAIGEDKTSSDIAGARHFTHSPYFSDTSNALRKELVRLFRLSHRRYVRVLIVGGGAVGVEIASEIRNFAQQTAKKYAVEPVDAEVELVEQAPRILPRFDEEVSVLATKRLEKLGVKILSSKRVDRCSQNSVRLDDRERAADCIVWATGGTTVPFFTQYPKLFKLEQGKVVVDEYLRAVGIPNIFVIGDSAFTVFSGSIEAALNDASFVAENLVRTHKGKTAKEYEPSQPTIVLTLGGRWALSVRKGAVKKGLLAWRESRKYDKHIMNAFSPYKHAAKQWRRGKPAA